MSYIQNDIILTTFCFPISPYFHVSIGIDHRNVVTNKLWVAFLSNNYGKFSIFEKVNSKKQ